MLGNGDSYLRAGPDGAPLGIGSLGIRTGSAADEAAFGNQIDFRGRLVRELGKLDFAVYTTTENSLLGGRADNMPSLTFEIRPNLTRSTSSEASLVFRPFNTRPDTWTSIDATASGNGSWGLSGDAGLVTGCDLNLRPCTFDEVQRALDDGDGQEAEIVTAEITKGPDFAFSGAVDALVINDQTFDFEPLGVLVR